MVIEQPDQNRRKYRGQVLVKCKYCGTVKAINEMWNLFKIYCNSCKVILVKNYDLTPNAIIINCEEYEHKEGIMRLRKKLDVIENNTSFHKSKM